MSRLFVGIVTAGLLAACQKPAQAKPEADAPVATWNGGSITTSELDAQMFDQRKQALEQLVVRRLVEQKAKAENLTPEALFKREVMDKVKPPPDAEMKKFYDEQAAKQPLPPFDQVKDQIAQFMTRPQIQQAQQAFVEKLKADAGVKIALRPPKIEVASTGPSKGADKAPVTIVEFSDFECPYCSRAEETVEKVMKAYDGKVKLVFRDFPLPIHARAQKAAEASHCAADQGKFWEMHKKLYDNQKALEPVTLKTYAKDLGLDQAKFDKCLDSGDKAKAVEANRKDGEKAGVTGTPAFFINGYMLSGAQPFEEFKSIIDAELAKR